MLLDAKETIDLDRRRDFNAEPGPVPRGIEGAAYRIASNAIIIARERQHMRDVQRDKPLETGTLVSQAFTADIARDLLLYPAGLNFRMKRVRTRRQIEDAATNV